MKSGSLRRDGVDLHYVDGGGRRALIFQHGLTATAQQVADLSPSLREVRQITLECRGHGLSPLGPGDRLSIRSFAEDVIALCAALGIERAAFAGISMGAAITQQIAVTHPALVEGLVLIRPAWIDRAAPANLRPYAEVGHLLAEHSPSTARAIFAAGETASMLRRAAPDNLASLLGMFDHSDPATTARLLLAIANDGPGTTEAEISQIAVPALVIGNRLDFAHPLDYAQKIHRLLRQSDFLEAPPKATNPASFRSEVTQAIERFMSRLWRT